MWGELVLGLYALLALWQGNLSRQPDLLPIVAIYILGESLMVSVTILQDLHHDNLL
jgi:hypothetical protein